MTRKTERFLLATLLLGAGMTVVHANDIEGEIESIDAGARSFVVQGIRFYTTDRTDYDRDLRAFNSLKPRMRVEVDFEYRDGRHIATEIERDD